MALQHLRFFNKRGDQIPADLVNGVYKFNMYFEEVSTGLFSSEHLFILEEVYKEVEGNVLNTKKKGIFTPLLIRVMRYIRDYNGPLKKDLLNPFFTTLSIYKDYVGEYVNKKSNLILGSFDGQDIYYTLTAEGERYVNDYDDKERESLLDNERKIIDYVRPRSNFDISKNEDTYFYFRWRIPDKFDKNIFPYFIDTSDEQIYYEGSKSLCLDKGKKIPAIVPLYSSDIEPDNVKNPTWKKWFSPYRFDNGTGDSYLDTTVDELPDTRTHRVLNSEITLNQKPFQFNFALTSDIEGQFTRALDLFMVRSIVNPNGDLITNVYQVAQITFYGEVIGEDERLKLILENFGRQVDENDTYVFRDTDIEEDLPNYITLNEKRKELLLAGEDIYNYIGSYKAFVNAMKFFGYQDLRLKEYFINVILSNPKDKTIYYSAVEIPLDLKVDFDFSETKDFNQLIFGGLIDNKVYMKSSRFGLYYDLNRITDEIDDLGFPIVEDVFAYTDEEILIKLYGLKQVLQKYYLPHHARIIDITGEGVYFAKFKMNSWITQNPIIALNYELNPDFIATPRIGKIKQLDKLLNIFKINIEEINDVLELNENDLISTIANKSLSEFIKSTNTDFQFDLDLGIDIIKRFYPDYWKLKSAVYNHLKNSDCPCEHINYSEETLNPIFIEKRFIVNSLGPTAYYQDVAKIPKVESDKILYQAFEHSLKLLGQPVLIEALAETITWDDLGVRYSYLENEMDKQNVNFSVLNVTDTDEVDRYNWGSLSVEDTNILKRLIYSKSKLFTWESIGFYGSQWMEWYIHHTEDKYCYKVEGIISKTKEILVFLPQTGFYDVRLTVRDINNFPRIKEKKKYLEVENTSTDFIAFGRFIKKETIWDTQENTVWKDFNGIWDYSSYCEKETTFDDALILWDDLNYSTYKAQNFSKDIISSRIIDYNEKTFEIIIDGVEFWENYRDYQHQKWRNVLVTERLPELVPTYNLLTISNIKNKTITLDGIINMTIGEKINVYKYFNTNEMIVSDNSTIDVVSNYVEAFDVGRVVSLLHASTLSKEIYEINDVNIDYTKNLVRIKTTDDGSLYSIPHNRIEFTGDNYIFKVKNVLYDYDNDQTIIEVLDSDANTRDIIKKGFNNYRVDVGINCGRYVFEIQSVSVENGNTRVRIEPNTDICNISSTFNVLWKKDYDFDWTDRFGTTENYKWNNFNNSNFDIQNQTWNMLEYHNSSITGFKIYTIDRDGWIKFNDTLLNISIPDTVALDSELYYIQNILSNSTLTPIKDFYYNVVNNDYIQATSKILGQNSLISITSSNNIECENSSYPRANFGVWKSQFYDGYNNPANWHYLNQDDKNWAISGSFNYTDTFISYKDMTLPIFTTLFIVHSNDEISYNSSYEWELWHQTTNKLLLKSDYRYLVWNFVDKGVYTVKLKFIDENGNTKNLEKTSWIKIV